MSARSILVSGVVQGVGFRPFVFRLARANTLAGWVLNGDDGVEIYLEGTEPALDRFIRELETQPPPAALITEIRVARAEPAGGVRALVVRQEVPVRDRPVVGHAVQRPHPEVAREQAWPLAAEVQGGAADAGEHLRVDVGR